MSKFEGTVEDIVFRNDQNGWTVAAIKLDGDNISASFKLTLGDAPADLFGGGELGPILKQITADGTRIVLPNSGIIHEIPATQINADDGTPLFEISPNRFGAIRSFESA